ncbi:hypothetical protein ONS95_010020 [Cadophora gregata]|uniref:uncharacterized protein n=1 Tax=Cadophora gregata TaxID=51156 RepID=UPI0026DD09A5|nr:uncharacterized protein ONS95_010020 [Cadophora gregata]KAK0121734.1 hypothetical protein ONS95_010020 [Cadophora gregata]KAK0127210.1 hypothetical protein ONS96_006763 [Cadophora gregata f. sp. sojae]
MRCANYGTKCEGYKPPASAITPNRRVVRPILPKSEPLCKTPTTVSKLFKNDQELSYFQRFCVENVRQLTGSRGSEIWSRHVLQASEVEPCVRHAVIAIGALDFRKRGLEAGLIKPITRNYDKVTGPETLETDRLEFAYREYGKAISCMKTAIANKKISIRTSLITSLLFVCFEAYHGNSDGASAQVYAAVEAMEAYSKQRRVSRSHPSTPITPPIDDDIAEMFSLLEIQATSWGGDTRSSDLHLERMRDCEITIGEMPREFKDMRYAWRMISQLLLRGIHLRSAQLNAQIQGSLTADPSPAPIITLGPLADEAQHAAMRSVLSQFRQWGLAFEPILRRAESPHASKEMVQSVMMLHLYHLAGIVWAVSGSADKADYYRCYTKELHEIVRISKLISRTNDEYFSLDIRIVMPLQVVAMNFRHRALRKEVIGIFSRMPMREGMWDAAMIVKVLEWITEIEEVGLGDDEYVPEDRMATLTGLRVDAESRTAVVKCVQGVRGCPGQTIERENTLYW